ncbi:MAG: hypothetical protein IKP08_02300 [Bacteroidales bacterium]|nr:hypothetical protein [Bacteroidales bacterium]
MQKTILKTLCVCSLAIAATACSEKQGTVDDNPELVTMGYQGKTIVVKDAVNDDNLVLKVYAKDEATLALCDASNFTFISDPQSKNDYYAKMEAVAETEEEILPDTEELDEPEGIDSTYIIEILQINLKNPQNSFIYAQDLPNPNANNELKGIVCGNYIEWGCVQRWASIRGIEVWNTATGICNGIKVKIFDQCPITPFHGYAWRPSDPSPHEWELKKNGRKHSIKFEYKATEKVQGPNNTLIWGTVTVCSSPRKDKNRNKLSFEVQYQ